MTALCTHFHSKIPLSETGKESVDNSKQGSSYGRVKVVAMAARCSSYDRENVIAIAATSKK